LNKPNNLHVLFEYLIIGAVIFSAVALYYQDSVSKQDEYDLIGLSGSVELATRDSMDAFGLQTFDIGAVAQLNLTVTPALVSGCEYCPTDTSGVRMQGTVVITDLIDSEGRLGRVEGELNFTHLATYSATNYITEEHVSFDWSAGDINSSWNMILRHDPPRWLPNQGLTTLFVETDLGLEARAGPEILIDVISPEKRIIKACLPDSFLCRSASPDALIVADYGAAPEPVLIAQLNHWELIDVNNFESNQSVNTPLLEILQVQNNTNNIHGFTPLISTPPSAASTFNLGVNSTRLAPLSSWFNAVGLMSIELDVSSHNLVYLQYSDLEIYNLLDTNKSLRIGLMID